MPRTKKKLPKAKIQEDIKVIPEEEPVVIEKIVYKKQRVHWFFRTLTILVLLAIGFLMLGESTGIAKLTMGDFALDKVYPIFIIFSTIIIRSYRDVFGKIFGLILFLGVFGGFFTIRIYNGLDQTTPARFWETLVFEMTDKNTKNISIQTMIGKIDLEGNTKSPHLQGTRISDREMITEKASSGNVETISIVDNNTLNLLEDFFTNLTLYVPSSKTFDTIYIKNALGNAYIKTENLNRDHMMIHGGINKVTIDITDDIPANATIEIQWSIQNIQINIPKEIGIQMRYQNRIGYKNAEDMIYQTWHLYTSTNITWAQKTLMLDIKILIGKLNINRE